MLNSPNDQIPEALADTTHGQAFFNEIVADLVYLPDMRQPLFNAFRNPERSPVLAKAVGTMFQGVID